MSIASRLQAEQRLRLRLPSEAPGRELLLRQGLFSASRGFGPHPASVAVIVNPHSANGSTGRSWPALGRLFAEAGLDFRWEYTPGPLAATDLTRQALRAGYGTILSVGGDGTLNEVVNGFFGEDGTPLNPEACLGVIPRGTGCDFARTAGIPRNELAALRRVMAAPPHRVDVGRVRFRGLDGHLAQRFFLNVADAGLGGETVRRVNGGSKALGGPVSFLAGALASLVLYRNKDVAVCVDGRELPRSRVSIVAVANGQYFGGGMRIAPGARLDSGVFEVIVVGDVSRPDLVWNLPRVYRGSHLTHPKVARLVGRQIVLKSAETVCLDVDGEQPGFLDAEFSILPGALRLRM